MKSERLDKKTTQIQLNKQTTTTKQSENSEVVLFVWIGTPTPGKTNRRLHFCDRRFGRPIVLANPDLILAAQVKHNNILEVRLKQIKIKPAQEKGTTVRQTQIQ